MRFFEKTKGSVSVFLILVLMPMYTCTYLAVDTARYTAAESKVNGAMDLTGNAALANYDKDLRELYGIFAMSVDSEELTDGLAPYFSNMINTGEMPLVSDTFIRVLLNNVISEIALSENGKDTKDEFENVVNTGVSDFSAAYVENSDLVDTGVLEGEIQKFMKYRAPLSFATGTMQKLSAFVDVGDISNVFDLGSDYYSSLSGIEDSLASVFNSFPSGSESTEDMASALSDVLGFLPNLRKDISGTEEKAEGLNNAIGELSEGEIKSLLASEYTSLTEILSSESVDSLETILKSDIEKLKTDPQSTELQYMDNPLYKYIASVYGKDSDSSVSSEDAKSIEKGLSDIGKTDLAELYKTYSEKSNFEVSGIIIYSIWDAIYDTSAMEGSDLKSVKDFAFSKDMILHSYETEYFTEMFACLTTTSEDKNLLGERYGDRPSFTGEAEYIIFGNDWLAHNFSDGINLIFATRLAMNSLYVFSNTNMRQEAFFLATALSGTSGLGVTLTQNLLLFAWSVAESILDVSSLCKGDTVPVYKSAATWTLQTNNVVQTVANGVEGYVCRQIDDIFYQIESSAENGYESVTDSVLNYMNQTGESVTENLTNMILAPVEKEISSLTSTNIMNYTRSDIERLITDAVNSVDNESKGFEMAKNLFLTYGLPKLTDVIVANLPNSSSPDVTLSEAALAEVRNAVSDAYTDLFEMLRKEVEKFEDEQLSYIREFSDETGQSLKDAAVTVVDDYASKLSEFLGSEVKTSVSSSAGLGMTYKDYLKLFAFLKACNKEEKEQMLRRAMCVMQINCSGTKLPGGIGETDEPRTEFDISKCYTRIKLDSKVNVGVHRIEKSEVYSY